ncbi:hypothetical protein CsatB_021756 [Cannabis sativa]
MTTFTGAIQCAGKSVHISPSTSRGHFCIFFSENFFFSLKKFPLHLLHPSLSISLILTQSHFSINLTQNPTHFSKKICFFFWKKIPTAGSHSPPSVGHHHRPQ